MTTPSSDFTQILGAGRLLLARRDFRAVLGASMLLGLAVSFVLPFLSMFGTLEVGMSLAEFGWFMTATAIANISISTFLSHRSDRLTSRRGLMLAGAAAGALGYAGYAFVRDVWLLLPLGGVVLGIATQTFSQLFAYARELLARSDVPPSQAPLYMNTFRMCFALSWTVGPAIAAFVLAKLEFRGLFLGAALLYASLWLWIWWLVPAAAASAPTEGGAALPPSALLARPRLLAWFGAFVLVYAAHSLSMSNMSLLVLKVLGGDEGHVGVIFSLAPLFELPFMLYFGLLATRTDAARLIRVAVVLAVVYYAALSQVTAPWQIYPLQFLSAAIVSVTSGVAITFFQDRLPQHLGAATNLYANAARVGSTSGYLLFGLVATRFGHRGAYLACAALVAVALMLTAVRERQSTQADARSG